MTRVARPRGLTLLEMLISGAMLLMLLSVLAFTLTQSEKLFRQTSGRDDAVRQMLLARSALTRDLQSACVAEDEYATDRVPEHIPTAGFDGDALTFLSTDDGRHSAAWSTDPDNGSSLPASQVTFWLATTSVPDPSGIVPTAGPTLDGYDQQNPCKWMVRRRTACAPLTPAHPLPAIDTGWPAWLSSPSGNSDQTELVARNLLSFRVLRSGGLWSFQLRAVALDEARRHLPLGSTPLANSPYTLEERFSVVIGR